MLPSRSWQPAHMIIRLKAFSYLTAIVLVFGVVLRVLYLDADPQYYDWIGYITDEGRWVYQARDFFLFNTISRDKVYDLHLFLAPLFQLVNYFIFNLIGSSSLSSRIFTAFCGSALLLLFWKNLRHIVTPQALLVGVMLLAVQVDFVVLSRLAVPEMVIIFFEALIYFALVTGEPSRRRMATLGILMLIAVGMKGTAAFFLGIFSMIILFMPRAPGESAGRPWRSHNLLWFWGGFAAPVLISSAVWIGCCAPESLLASGKLSGSAHILTFIGFIRFSNVFHILSFFFKDSLAPALYILAMGLWLSWLGWIAADREDVDDLTRRCLVTSTTWIVAYLALMLAMDYFPQRYMLHIVLPMVINITVGISLLHKVGIRKVLAALQRRDRVQLLRLAVFVAPTAAFLVPLLASAIALGGIDPGRLVIQLFCIAVTVAVTTYIARQFASREKALNLFVVFPLVQASLWVFLTAALADASLWPTADGNMSRSLYLGSVAVASMVTLVVTLTGPGAVTAAPRLVTIYALSYLAASIIRLAPAYLDPHFTIRDISRDLGVLLDSGTSIATSRAEGLFNDNSLRYRYFDRFDLKDNAPEIVVTVFDDSMGVREILEERYHVIKTAVLYVSPQYQETHPTSLLPKIKVYKKNQ